MEAMLLAQVVLVEEKDLAAAAAEIKKAMVPEVLRVQYM